MNTNDAFVLEQTEKLAQELGSFAERPVTVELRGGKDRKTFGSQGRSRSIVIVLNPAVLSRVRNEEAAVTIWRGLAFHQLLKALWSSEDERGQAAREGCSAVFDLVDHEHNERRAMASNPDLGAAFQTVCAYVYNAKERRRDDVINRGVGGCGEPAQQSPSELEACQTYVRRFNEFAYHFRRHLAPEPGVTDASVLEALSLVPAGLKDLSKAELVGLARQLHERLARGIVLPAPADAGDENEIEAAADEAASPACQEPVSEEVEDELAGLSPADPRWWQILLRSKWSWVTLGSFIFLWLAIFLSFGLEFWSKVIAVLVLLGLSLTAATGIVAYGRYQRYRRRGGPRGDDETGCPLAGLWKKLCSWCPFSVHFHGFGEFGEAVARQWKLFLESCRRFAQRVRDTFMRWRGSFCAFCATVSEHAADAWRSPLVRHLRTNLAAAAVAFRLFVERTAYLIWCNSYGRLALVAAPFALAGALAITVVMWSSELLWWQLGGLALAWFCLLSLSWIYRARLKTFLVGQVLTDEELEHDVECQLPIDTENTAFRRITRVVRADADPSFVSLAAFEVSTAAARLRPVFDRLGFADVDRDDRSEGHDLIEELEQALLGETDLFVAEEQRPRLSMDLQVLVDCSSSMIDPTRLLKRGEKFSRARKMALAIEQAARGKKGLSAHFWGFTDSEILDCGEAGACLASGLTCAGENNDAAALQHAAEVASSRGKDVKVIVLISDVQPAACPWRAVNHLGWKLTEQGVIVVQVAVDRPLNPALPWHVVDLHEQALADAADSLGRILEMRVAGR